MSFHQNYSQWLAMTVPAQCPVCQDRSMPEGMVDIYEFSSAWLNAVPVDCLKGACHLLAKQHVVELYDFNRADLLAFMQAVQYSARALKVVTEAVKINYEIHGNSIPHLHVHLYPRYQDDPFPGQPIDYHRTQRWYSTEEFSEFVQRMQQTLAALIRVA